MPDDTPILGLPLILPAQAQKHVTHNEALRLLDILVQLSVLSRARTSPPATPVEGDRYIVAANATGAWAGQSGRIAAFWGGIWVFIPARDGWITRVLDENIALAFTGGLWTRTDAPPESIARLGIGTTPDATNRLSVVSPASLFSHAGTDHRIVVNKASATDTASILLQSGFSGRAELGLTGSNALSFRVSADGSSFATALTLQPDASVSLPQGLTVTGPATLSDLTITGNLVLSGTASGSALQASPQDGTPGRILTTGAFGLGAASAPLIANLDATATLAGEWRTSDPGTTGTWPPGATTALLRAGQLSVQRPDATTILQRWIQTDSANDWTRRNTGTGWTAWGRSLPINGTVSMTSGLPTGSILQRGTTVNGDFIRFADGTQICTFNLSIGPINSALGSLFQGAGSVTWTFPQAFTAAPVVSGMTTNATAWITAGTPVATSIAFRGLSATSITTAVPVNVMAIGRWV